MGADRIFRWSASNWFVLVAPLLSLAAWLISRSTPWPHGGAGMEAALLVDACITVPALYLVCYWRTMPLWQLAVRAIAIACLGIFLLGYIIPAGSQVLLPEFAAARTVGMVLLFLIEVRLVIGAVRMVFTSEVSAEKLSKETGAPPLIAKMMVLEARLWKAVWRFLRR